MVDDVAHKCRPGVAVAGPDTVTERMHDGGRAGSAARKRRRSKRQNHAKRAARIRHQRLDRSLPGYKIPSRMKTGCDLRRAAVAMKRRYVRGVDASADDRTDRASQEHATIRRTLPAKMR